jgi:hypothetical protein
MHGKSPFLLSTVVCMPIAPAAQETEAEFLEPQEFEDSLGNTKRSCLEMKGKRERGIRDVVPGY